MVPASREPSVQGWEQLIPGAKRRDGQPPSLAGKADLVRDVTSRLDLKGQVGCAIARNWKNEFPYNPGDWKEVCL